MQILFLVIWIEYEMFHRVPVKPKHHFYAACMCPICYFCPVSAFLVCLPSQIAFHYLHTQFKTLFSFLIAPPVINDDDNVKNNSPRRLCVLVSALQHRFHVLADSMSRAD